MSNLLEVLAVMCELTGTEWSEQAVKAIERELAGYPLQDAIQAVTQCQREARRKVTLADILDRLPSQHPGVEEAWALVSKTMNNEQISICWTDEMRQAYGSAYPLSDDKVAARMAFKETYSRLVSAARANRRLPSWAVSLGYDPIMRDECVREAAQKNLISQATASKLLAYDPPTAEAVKLLEKL